MQPYIPPANQTILIVRERNPQQHWVQFFQTFPELSFPTVTAQAGPVKPSLPIEPKPNDPKPVPVVPKPEQLVNIKADQQNFDVKTNTVTVKGNVVITYQESELKADQVTLNLTSQQTTATGNVLFTRGEQKVAGELLEYNYGNRQGRLVAARGTVNLDTIDRPPSAITSRDISSGSITLSLGGQNQVRQKGVRRLGFIADEIRLQDRNWVGTNVRITNDPFSPPELEVVTPEARLSPVTPTQDVLELDAPRLVFDRSFSLPLPIGRITLDNLERELPIFVGFDRQDRGGLFYQQNFDLIARPDLRFQISPQLFVQRSLESSNPFNSSILGVTSRLEAILPEGQYIGGRASLSSFDLNNVGNQLRGILEYSRPAGDLTFKAQYAYRERFFNGSLAFQDVQNSIGVGLFSPTLSLGDSGINLNYQAGLQLIDADRSDVTRRDVLFKHESAVVLNRFFPLWRGQPLEAAPDKGLKYSSEPVVPKLDGILGVTGAYSVYSSGELRGLVTGTAGLSATLGNYSRNFLDFTQLDLSYSQTGQLGESPFLFDRIADRQIITAGIKQQIFGPVRVGYQQSWNPSTGNTTDSVYTIELERRTYALVLRFNPTRETGEIFLRISDFNWNAPPSEISGSSP